MIYFFHISFAKSAKIASCIKPVLAKRKFVIKMSSSILNWKHCIYVSQVMLTVKPRISIKDFFFSTHIFLFRMATILYYLNDVEEGGETAFIVADNSTLNESVSMIW